MNETILVVDDEPKIVKQARDYLERSGYRVLEAGDGKTALAQARHPVNGRLLVRLASGWVEVFTGLAS
jgi:DNA-binding response OmpR family regulator